MVALIPTRRALLCSSFLKMLSLGRHGLFKSRGLETSGEVQPRILKFAQSISQRIVMNLSQWCPNKFDKSKTDAKAEYYSSYSSDLFFLTPKRLRSSSAVKKRKRAKVTNNSLSIVHISNYYYGLAVASPYVGMA